MTPTALIRVFAALAAASIAASVAQAQPIGERLDEIIRSRVEGDRSGVCIQAALIEIEALPSVRTAEACANPRADAPARDARFEIGSISKAMTGVLIAEMIERGELKLDEPLQALLPEGAAAPATNGAAVTVADLVTHTSGLPPLPPGYRPRGGLANPYAEITADDIYGPLGALRQPGPPPQRYAYSNWAFMLLSDAAARRAGMPFDELLRERVLAPLGMNDTVVARNERLVRGRTSYGAPAPNWDFPARFAGVGAIRSTLDDMTRFARAMLGDVPATAPDTLKRALPASRARLRTANERLDLGIAWHLLKRADGSTWTFHNGMTGGFSASLALDPERRRGSIVLADAFGGFDDLALHLLDPKTTLQTPRRTVALDMPAALAAVGRYQLAPGFVLAVTVDDGRLYAQATGQGRFELLQDSRGEYYAIVTELRVRFAREPDGRVTALTLVQGGAATPAARIDD
jgi:CubicO group peptidase (beta-lactamase class C family)